ncbi:Mediator complex subunit rgr-1 [Aphelenchoides fujianensis]|nr:Mediator complex subunit rgr-1 [Aphelenchoides fujianensis]
MNVLMDRQNQMAAEESGDEATGGEEDEQPSFAERFTLPPVPEQCGPPTVALSRLIDLAVQETYRQWTQMLEILDKRPDADRKLGLMEFTRKTRTLFLKLYAVVKWVRVAKPFDQLTTSICFVLDQLSQQYVDTADNFVQLAKEELVFAKLPVFQVSTAVDVLSLGTMPRLPVRIKNRHTREAPLSKREKLLTLQWMEKMLEYRLLQESRHLPAGFTRVLIERGTVVFTAPDEFEVRMSLRRDEERNPADFDYDFELQRWRWELLEVRVLIVDYEVGMGAPLVHAKQQRELVELCRAAMLHGLHDVHIVYDIVHEFCMKLQLDLLFCQAQCLSESISDEYVRVDAYDAVEGALSISYWTRRPTTGGQLAPPMRIVVTREFSTPYGGLKLRHHPYGFGLPQIERDGGQPQFHSLFTTTILFRCRERLLNVKRLFRAFAAGSPTFRLIGDASIRLMYRLLPLDDATSDESLHVAVNTFSGRIVCSVPALEERAAGCAADDDENWAGPSRSAENRSELVDDLEDALNVDCRLENATIEPLLRRIHVRLMLRRFAQVSLNFHFRPVSAARLCSWMDEWGEAPRDRLYLQFLWEPRYFLILALELETMVELRIRLVLADTDNHQAGDQRADGASSKVNIQELSVADLVVEAPVADVENTDLDVRDYFVPTATKFGGSKRQIRAAISLIADRLLIVRLTEQLRRRGIAYAPLEREPQVGGYRLKLTDFTEMLQHEPAIPPDSDLFSSFVSCTLRIDSYHGSLRWPFECTLRNVPLICDHEKTPEEVALARKYFFTYVQEVSYDNSFMQKGNQTILVDSIQRDLIDRIKIYANMFDLAQRFSLAYEEYFSRCCSILNFSYHKLTILYGSKRDLILIISYKVQCLGFWLNFAQAIGRDDERPYNNKWNAHSMVAAQLIDRLRPKPLPSGEASTSEGAARLPPRADRSEATGLEDPVLSVVNYVMNTDRTINLIYHFSYAQLRSQRSHAAVHGMPEELVPLELKCNLTPLAEDHIRMQFGDISLDFWLLHGNCCAVEACTWKDAGKRRDTDEHAPLPHFLAFWSKMAGKRVEDRARGDDPATPTTTLLNGFRLGGPASVESISTKSGTITNPPSCPSQLHSWTEEAERMDAGEQPERPPDGQETEDDRRPLIHLPLVIVDGNTLKRAMEQSEKANSPPAPLETYLNACTFVARMAVGLRALQRTHRQAQYITNLRSCDQWIAFELDSIDPSCRIAVRIFVCEREFELKCELKFGARSLAPAQDDLQVFEDFFKFVVAPMCNEYAFLSFLIICRISLPYTLPAFACLMRQHMASFFLLFIE